MILYPNSGIIVRIEEAEDGSFGFMILNDNVFCATLEPPDKNNQNNISNIPPGQYICKLVDSPKFGPVYKVMDVPGRTDILFHSGNVVENTEGCILLGKNWGSLKGDRAILNSGLTMALFLARLNGAPFNLQILELGNLLPKNTAIKLVIK